MSSGLDKLNWWLLGEMAEEFEFQDNSLNPRKSGQFDNGQTCLRSIRDKGSKEVWLLSGLQTPSGLLPDEGGAGRGRRKTPHLCAQRASSARQRAAFPAGRPGSSPASEILGFGHSVKYELQLAWPQKANQLSSCRINSLTSLLTGEQSPSSELR